MTGDFDRIVKVTRLDSINRWSKAGLMVRESRTDYSRTLNVMVTPPDVPALDGSGNGANCYIAPLEGALRWPGG